MGIGRIGYLGVLFGCFLVGENQVDAADCSAIVDPGARLNCYDALQGSARGSAASAQSKWTIRTTKSKLDDSDTVVLLLDSEEFVPQLYGAETTQASLVFRCAEKQTIMMVGFGNHFMADSGQYGQVDVRPDKLQAFRVDMTATTDNKWLGLWRAGDAVYWAKILMKHDSLVVRATPFNENPIVVTFPIDGLDEAIKPLREACGW
ncbi:type VI secretion system-associated protein TagO [Allorhizobium ampelinum]|uniref:type VI secretion system-associated protein TagO n=1 Tax=Allorhizobium ampelinum TaxID=3025782 RepID=UPI001F177325